MHKTVLYIILFSIVCILEIQTTVHAQTSESGIRRIKLDNYDEVLVLSETKDSIKVCAITHGACKGNIDNRVFSIAKDDMDKNNPILKAIHNKQKSILSIYKRQPILTAKGNVNYEYYYNQMIDTPFTSSSFKQHTVTAQVHLLYKSKYPFNLHFVVRSSNNNYFPNFINVGALFDIRQFQEIQKNDYLNALQKNSKELKAIQTNNKIITDLENQFKNTENEMNDPAVLQKIIHEREMALKKKLGMDNGVKSNSDSSIHLPDTSLNLNKKMDSVKKEENKFSLTSLKGFLKNKTNTDSLTKKYTTLPKSTDSTKNDSTNKFNRSDTSGFLTSKTDTSIHLSKDSLLQKQNFVSKSDSGWSNKYLHKGNDSAVQHTPTEIWYENEKQKLARIDSQRTALTKYNDSLKKVYDAQQMSVNQNFDDKDAWKKHTDKYGNVGDNKTGTGFLSNVKSVGIGQTNVNYSLLTIRNTSLTGLELEYEPKQYYAIAAGRVDYRYRDFFVGNSIPAQEFIIVRVGTNTKKKQGIILSGFSGRKNLYVNNNLSQNYFTGYSILTFYKLNKDNYIEYEIAKTTSPPPTNYIQNGKSNIGLFNLNTDVNLATAVKVHLVSPVTHTKFEGIYQKFGENFQSINVLTNGVRQQAWSVKGEQIFYHKMFTATAMIRENDFDATGYTTNYNTNTVFKSFLLSFHKRKLPFFSIGYFPGTQLVKSDSGKIVQNMYYMYNATAGYSKMIKKYVYTTVLNFNEFINQSTDTGFTYFNGRTVQFTQNFSSTKYSFEQSIAYTKQQILAYYSLESGVGIVYKWLGVNVAEKYNQVITGTNYWGNRVNVSVSLKKLGVIQCTYDQQFIPGKVNTLTKADMGRINYIKYF